MALMKTVTAKLGGMRKPQEFVIYKPDVSDPSKPVKVVVQANTVIGQFDPATGKGLLNWRGSNSKHFAHLISLLGAEEYQFPAEFVKQVMDSLPSTGDKIGPGVYIG